jgi:hypothetical protein
MSVPEGILSHFDLELYRPFANNCLKVLAQKSDNVTLRLSSYPAFYVFEMNGKPIEKGIQKYLLRNLPRSPKVTLDEALFRIELCPMSIQDEGLLDFAELLKEDLTPAEFNRYSAAFPMIVDALR